MLIAKRINHDQTEVYQNGKPVGHITEVWDPYTGGMYHTSQGGWYVDLSDAIDSFGPPADPMPVVPFDGQVPF